jgi:hypothetical protein
LHVSNETPHTSRSLVLYTGASEVTCNDGNGPSTLEIGLGDDRHSAFSSYSQGHVDPSACDELVASYGDTFESGIWPVVQIRDEPLIKGFLPMYTQHRPRTPASRGLTQRLEHIPTSEDFANTQQVSAILMALSHELQIEYMTHTFIPCRRQDLQFVVCQCMHIMFNRFGNRWSQERDGALHFFTTYTEFCHRLEHLYLELWDRLNRETGETMDSKISAEGDLAHVKGHESFDAHRWIIDCFGLLLYGPVANPANRKV